MNYLSDRRMCYQCGCESVHVMKDGEAYCIHHLSKELAKAILEWSNLKSDFMKNVLSRLTSVQQCDELIEKLKVRKSCLNLMSPKLFNDYMSKQFKD